jgi:D-glycero-D-manno-heptose 1,7-bisphosphate phosphatase
MHKAIFMDRDGVIIQNRPNYVLSWSDVEYLPQSFEALRIIHPTIKIIIITNQSAVGRGLITLQAAQALNQRIEQEIRDHGGRVDGSYMCPHSPQQACQCRKPQPGLILRAARELDIDLDNSLLIGDALSDILAGKNAGIPKNILVETGRGSQQILLPELHLIDDILIYKNLLTAVLDQPGFFTR